MDSSSQANQNNLDRSRFTALWKDQSAHHDEAHCNEVFAQLQKLYQGGERFYHGAEHIIQCLEKLDEAEEECGRHPEVELATWFHDAVYVAGNSDNERKSAEWFRDRANGYLTDQCIQHVCDLITITEHRNQPQTDTEKLMVDVDLSSFSLPFDQFLRDGSNIRKEFKAYSDEKFVAGQRNFLTSLISRSSIFSTEYFFQHYEPRARDNINRLLEMYDQGYRPGV